MDRTAGLTDLQRTAQSRSFRDGGWRARFPVLIATDRRTFLKNWLPPGAWAMLIFVASSDLMSAEHTSQFIAPLLRWFWPNISGSTLATVQLVVRKAAHVVEYAILAVLLARAFKLWEFGSVHWPRVALVLFCASCCAALDEFHQSFVRSRTGSAVDVSIDIAGAAIGIAFYSGVARIRATRRRFLPDKS